MAAAVRATTQRQSHLIESSYSDVAEDDIQRSANDQPPDRQWTIFAPPSESLASSDWSDLAVVQTGALPTHDGRGVFSTSDSALNADWVEATDRTPSFSDSSHAAPGDDVSLTFSGSPSNNSDRISFGSMADDEVSAPLTERALATLPVREPLGIYTPKSDSAVLTSSSGDESDGEAEADLGKVSLSKSDSRRRRRLPYPTPSPELSDGDVDMLGEAPRNRSKAKRRHRRSGLSDKGSKRSNTSGSQVQSQPPRVVLKQQAPVRAASKVDVFLGRVVRNVFDLDEETLGMIDRQKSVTSPTPRGESPSSRHRPISPHGFSALSAHAKFEAGEVTLPYSAYSDEGSSEETETEHLTHIYTKASTSHETSPPVQRSLSLSHISHRLIDSVYASLPSSLYMSSSEADGKVRSKSPLRRTISFDDKANSDPVPAGGLEAAVSYWRSVLRRFRDGFDPTL